MLDFENVQLKAETTPVSMYSSCLHIVTITNTKKDYSIIYIYIYIYIYIDIALWHTKLCFHVQIEHSTRMSHCC